MEAVTRRFRVGLTGGIASGKTTVAQIFTALGVPVIDADEASRAVVAAGTMGLHQVTQRFGASVLDAEGKLNRRLLRERIFSDATARRDIEAILHPLIKAWMERESAEAGGAYQIFAIPLLVESGGKDGRVDRILVVDADENQQMHRLMARDSSSAEQAHAIMAAQLSRAARLTAADDVIDNQTSIAALRNAVEKYHHRYLQLAAARNSG